MNLLFVLPAYEPAWRFGGVVRCTSDLCRALVLLGHDVTVYTFDHANDKQNPGDTARLTCVDQGGVKTWFFVRQHGRDGLIHRLKETVVQFDLVYVAAIWQSLGVQTTRICVQNRVPVVNGLHGALTERHMAHRYFKKYVYWLLFVRSVLKKSAALHVTTLYEESQSRRWIGNAKTILLPNGIASRNFTAPENSVGELRRSLGIPRDVLVVLTVGRLSRVKRIELLIEAVGQVSGLHLVIAGGGSVEMVSELKRVANRCDVQDRITWLGHVEAEQLRAAYYSADLFALVSEDENFSMVTLEALHCELPVLLSPYVGVWEELQYDEVGRAVELDVKEISGALGSFKASPEDWLEMGKNGPKVASRFEIESVAIETANQFQIVIDSTA